VAIEVQVRYRKAKPHDQDVAIEAAMAATNAAFNARGETPVTKEQMIRTCAALIAFLGIPRAPAETTFCRKVALRNRKPLCQDRVMKQIRWINLYPPCDDLSGNHPWRTTSWHTRELADHYARPGRIACVRIEFKEGDGL
jgi:hypothetical protein